MMAEKGKVERSTSTGQESTGQDKRKRRAKLYSFNRALRSNNLLKEDLKQEERQLNKDKRRSSKMTDHVKAIMTLKTKHVENTNNWMNNHLNRCLLILERGRHMQVVKPYFHAPGKPLTPYHKKKENQRQAEEEAIKRKAKPKHSRVFLEFREPNRFSHCRDNCHVIDLNKFMNNKRS